jgi:hypothetical protein
VLYGVLQENKARKFEMRSFYVLLFLAVSVTAQADTLYLKNGKVVGGTYLGGTARQIRMDLGDRVASYDLADVAKIEFQSVSAAAAPDPPPPPREQPDNRPRLRRSEPDSEPAFVIIRDRLEGSHDR